MKKIGLALLVLVIGLIPAMASAGDPYERFNGGYEQRRMLPAASYPSDRYGGYIGEGSQAQCRPPDRHERLEASCYRQCEKQVRVKAYRPESTKMVQKKTVIVNYQKPVTVKPCLTPRKVERYCTDPRPNLCFMEVGRLSAELRNAERELGVARERERVSSVERQKLAEENATLRERARNREAWIEEYGKEYIKNNGWR
ncbi:MAG TPA: hypothetical protein VF390_01180 [Patescibacteria group bacterium]